MFSKNVDSKNTICPHKDKCSFIKENTTGLHTLFKQCAREEANTNSKGVGQQGLSGDCYGFAPKLGWKVGLARDGLLALPLKVTAATDPDGAPGADGRGGR